MSLLSGENRNMDWRLSSNRASVCPGQRRAIWTSEPSLKAGFKKKTRTLTTQWGFITVWFSMCGCLPQASSRPTCAQFSPTTLEGGVGSARHTVAFHLDRLYAALPQGPGLKIRWLPSSLLPRSHQPGDELSPAADLLVPRAFLIQPVSQGLFCSGHG